MVKCDRCDCEVNSFSLKQHYKTRLCTRITKLSEVDINKRIIDKQICSLYEKQIDIYNQIKKLSFESYYISHKIKELDDNHIMSDTTDYTLDEYLTLEKYDYIKENEQI